MPNYDPLKKVSAGEKLQIRADTFNHFVDAAQDYIRRRGSGNKSASDAPVDQTVILVRNNTGASVNRFGILGLNSTAPLIDPSASALAQTNFQEQIAIEGDFPAVDGDPFVVMLEPLADTKIGRAVISGAVQVQ